MNPEQPIQKDRKEFLYLNFGLRFRDEKFFPKKRTPFGFKDFKGDRTRSLFGAIGVCFWGGGDATKNRSFRIDPPFAENHDDSSLFDSSFSACVNVYPGDKYYYKFMAIRIFTKFLRAANWIIRRRFMAGNIIKNGVPSFHY